MKRSRLLVEQDHILTGVLISPRRKTGTAPTPPPAPPVQKTAWQLFLEWLFGGGK